MKIYKKVLIFLICLALAIFCSACGANKIKDVDIETAPESPAQATESAIVETTGPTAEVSAATATEEPAATEETVDQVLYEGNDTKIVFSSVSSNMFGPEINVYVENNSTENITVQVRDCSVNGFMIEPIFSCEVAAGKKANDSITFMSQNLESNNITQIDTIELSMHIFNSESWDVIADSDPVLIKLNDSGGEAAPQASGEVLYESGGVLVMYQSISTDGIFGPEINVYVKNNSEQNITVQARDCSINGFMIEPIFSCEVAAGKKANNSLTFMSQDLEANNITEINTIELSMHIFDSDSWDVIADSEPITINVQ